MDTKTSQSCQRSDQLFFLKIKSLGSALCFSQNTSILIGSDSVMAQHRGDQCLRKDNEKFIGLTINVAKDKLLN